ncbi:hypothetical protein AVEN_125962-1 [Araneus ventricosus]|uniref:Tc1-like transposase DDE domain-containing protein n=1 Tax=Araneus ventricosus TaxID=182803 RepID=A0A4Y2FQQ0_ARAVE|nr:hypothetical protein AVEN_125962-1 [Araneus ventricosus]
MQNSFDVSNPAGSGRIYGNPSGSDRIEIGAGLQSLDSTPSTTVPHPKGVMVWMGISAIGVTKPRFVQPGAKINSEYYIRKILELFLKDDYCRLYSTGDAVFHQDSAPSHASGVTQKFLTDQQVQSLKP